MVDRPNVRSILFKEEEGSYLVGMLAALKVADRHGSASSAAWDIPLIRNFACGYKGGVLAAKKGRQVHQKHDGHDGRRLGTIRCAAASSPVRRWTQGADVVFHAAGATGIGVLQAVADAGKLGIGVDSNQNMLHPGKVLTSMVKRVDNAVYQAFKDAQGGQWTAGTQTLGLKEDGVGYAVDDNNKALITPEMMAAVEKAKADIIAGTIKVHNYNTDNACPY